MKKYLFKNARIADPNSPWNGKKVDVYVSDGKIKRIGKDLKNRVKTIDLKGCQLLPGFCDLYADFCDPGFEHREDINSGIRAAVAGGYTRICIIPSTNPVNQNKSAIEYALHRSEHQLVSVCPLGAVSEDMKGVQPTEMYDMHEAGAVGFTDAPHSIKSSGLLLRALQYVQAFGGIVLDMSTDESLSNGGHINEGEVSVRMGMKGIPHMAEVVHIKRNIEILRYTGGRLHIYGITTRDGVDLIRQAKRDGLNITASVFAHHLLYTEADVSTFNANLKVHPPLRTERDRKALITGLKRGIIDCIVSQHTPLETEEKKTEIRICCLRHDRPGNGIQYATSGIREGIELC